MEAYDLRPACLPNCSSSEDRFFSALFVVIPRSARNCSVAV